MFDLKPDLSNNHVPVNERCGTMNLNDRVRKTAQNYENSRNYDGGGVQLRAEDVKEESGVSSPPLWKNNYQHLSPNSRSRAIARGQWELMEMVKTMPESCYELSLKDIVEKHSINSEFEKDCSTDEKFVGRQTATGTKAKMARSRSVENGGLLLKMALPFSLRSKKEKNLTTDSFSRVSPRPEGLDRCTKGDEKEWWKKRFSGSSDSGGVSGSSGRSGSIGSGGSRSSSGRKKSCCWSFLTKRNKKTSK